MEIENIKLMHGDCLEVMRDLPDCSIDSVVTDPPAGISFMGKGWDHDKGGRDEWIAWLSSVMAECLRVLKPGGHAVVWALPRTSHWTATAIEDAGFEIRDVLTHNFGSGFPKSANVSKTLRESGKACRCLNGALQYEHEGTEALAYLPNLQQGVQTEESQGVASSTLLHTPMLLAMESNGPNDSCSSESNIPSGGFGIQPARTPSQENTLGREQPRMEGRDNLQAQQGQLHRTEVHTLPTDAPPNGPQGRVHNGASSSNGTHGGAATQPNGSGTPHRPRHPQQLPTEPRTLAHEPDAQGGGSWSVCERCGLPAIPDGIGTALKPATEHWILARKPLQGTVASNVLAWGTGALNVDGCRVAWRGPDDIGDPTRFHGTNGGDFLASDPANTVVGHAEGRWPPNLVLTHSASCVRVGDRRIRGITGGNSKAMRGLYEMGMETNEPDGIRVGYADPDGMETVPAWECAEDCPVRALDGQSGERVTGNTVTRSTSLFQARHDGREGTAYTDTGGASRFFPVFEWEPEYDAPFLYQAKASRSERTHGGTVECHHPTVKPVALMRWLCRLVTPPGGTLLDPFAGSGTTGVAALREGLQAILIEREAEYAPIIEARLDAEQNRARQLVLEGVA